MKLLSIVLILTTAFISAGEDGKVFLKSEPIGAEVFLIAGDDGKELKSLGKTAGIFKLPEGKNKLLLRLANYADTFTEIEVKGTAIMKPDAIALEAITYSVDVVFAEEGWKILIDKVAQTEDGKLVTTPATVKAPAGKHEIRLSKDGFKDIVKNIDVMKNQVLDILDKPIVGSAKTTANAAPIPMLSVVPRDDFISKNIEVKTPKPVVAASSTLEKGNHTDNAVDGDRATFWCLKGNKGEITFKYDGVPCTTLVIEGRPGTIHAESDNMDEGSVTINDVITLPFKDFGRGTVIVIILPSQVRLGTVKVISKSGTWNPGISEIWAKP